MGPDSVIKVLKNEQVGRYTVTTKNLEPGEVIFTETPFAFGPKTDTPPVCLGCYTPVDGSYLCSKCSWPVCGPDCENAIAHASAECKVFKEAGVKWTTPEDLSEPSPQYDCITPLRVLLAKDENPERWEKEVKIMESHNEKRKQQEAMWNANRVNVVEFLRGPCKLAKRFDEELIHTVCGILEVNAFEARTSGGDNIRALYPFIAILSHNCVPNTAHSIKPGPTNDGDDFKLTIRATVKIDAGSELFCTYTYTLAPTVTRREHLLQSKYFECTCSRCSDPAELGTHSGSLKCNKCDPGLIVAADPLDPSTSWKCTHCDFKTSNSAVSRVVQTIQSEVDAVNAMGPCPEAVEACETIYRKYRSVLHPRHALFSQLRVTLTQLYGRAEGYQLNDLPDILLERKIDMCHDLLKVLDVIEPGYTRVRGMTLYELHATILTLARSHFQAEIIDKDNLRKKLNEAISLLEQAATILSLEDPSSPEGIIGAIAWTSLKELKDNIEALIEAC